MPRCLNRKIQNCLRSYPSKISLEQLLAATYQVAPEHVLVTSGGDDAIDRICRAYLEPDRELILPQPTFEMISQYARMAGATIRTVAWSGTSFPISDVLRAINDRTAVIAIVSPNNPTGLVATIDDLQTIAAACPQAVLMVDLAYVEFADAAYDLTQAALQIPSAVVVRTFSKAWGLAGLRVGYALSSPGMIDVLRRAGSPYPVSGPSLHLARAALQQQKNGRSDYVAAVKDERVRLCQLLTRLGGFPAESQGNFVFCRFPRPQTDDWNSSSTPGCCDAQFVADSLAAVGIGIRTFSSMPDAIRITCPGREPDFVRLKKSLTAALAPQAILFDMDGVLADEAPSYRLAIQQTCESFGTSISVQEIAQRKLAGNANNDWKFTFDLLSTLGVCCTFEEVKARFEALYQGADGQPGLWRHERLLVDPHWMQVLAQRLPLGIVTGRPRLDAVRFLEQHGIRDLLTTVVCMEDAAAKPDPAPVLKALNDLGVEHAWMIGDTPDDLNAARAAGVIPIGIVAPADDDDHAVEKLRSAAAVCILDRIETLAELLPW